MSVYLAVKPKEKIMLKGLLIALITLMLPSCSEPKSESPESVVQAFYQQYLRAFADFDPVNAEHSPMADNSPLIGKYIAADTAARIADLHQIYEQGILDSDYFTYCQDYAPEWVAALKVGKASPQADSVSVPVSIGIEEGKYLQLMVYLKHEGNGWKIYRVKNKTDNYEQNIFDDDAIKQARAHTR